MRRFINPIWLGCGSNDNALQAGLPPGDKPANVDIKRKQRYYFSCIKLTQEDGRIEAQSKRQRKPLEGQILVQLTVTDCKLSRRDLDFSFEPEISLFSFESSLSEASPFHSSVATNLLTKCLSNALS